MKCEVSLKHKSCLIWKGDSFSLQALHSSWKASKQTKAVPYAVVSVVTLWVVWCFLNILVRPTLLNSSPGGRIWWTKLTFTNHPAHLVADLNSRAKRSGLSWGKPLLSTKSLSWPINSNYSDISVMVCFGIYKVVAFIFIGTSNVRKRVWKFLEELQGGKLI